jgi:hypothetical protein
MEFDSSKYEKFMFDRSHHIFDSSGKNIIPLVYDSSMNMTDITNVLLIDSDVQNYNSFVQNCNSFTFPIVYSINSDKEELKNLLKDKFTNIERFAIVTNGCRRRRI